MPIRINSISGSDQGALNPPSGIERTVINNVLRHGGPNAFSKQQMRPAAVAWGGLALPSFGLELGIKYDALAALGL